MSPTRKRLTKEEPQARDGMISYISRRTSHVPHNETPNKRRATSKRRNDLVDLATNLPVALVAVSVCPVVHPAALPQVEAVLPLVSIAVGEGLHAPPVGLIVVPPIDISISVGVNASPASGVDYDKNGTSERQKKNSRKMQPVLHLCLHSVASVFVWYNLYVTPPPAFVAPPPPPPSIKTCTR